MTRSAKEAMYESMLFNYETTSKTDFREGKLKAYPLTPPYERPKPPPRPFEPVKFIGSMTGWKSHLPFGILHKPNEILQVDPRTPQKAYVCVEDLDRQKVQKTRPRLVMTPAVSVDDIPDEPRKILIESMYTTEMEMKMREAATLCSNVKAPMPDHPSPAFPVFLPKLKQPVVPHEWRMDSMRWDRRQLRSSVDPSQYFWTRPEHQPTRCNICEETAIVHAHRKRFSR